MTTRRKFMMLAGAAGLAGGWGGSARAQGSAGGWPSRSVRVISPTATGGPGQNFRFYADNLKETFGQSFVLENMPGGSGSVGCMAVARAIENRFVVWQSAGRTPKAAASESGAGIPVSAAV